jgi:hypothetical protein
MNVDDLNVILLRVDPLHRSRMVTDDVRLAEKGECTREKVIEVGGDYNTRDPFLKQKVSQSEVRVAEPLVLDQLSQVDLSLPGMRIGLSEPVRVNINGSLARRIDSLQAVYSFFLTVLNDPCGEQDWRI